jgi:hypothetical protein
MEYLTRWRMLLAGEKLKTSAEPIACSLGYALRERVQQGVSAGARVFAAAASAWGAFGF